MNFSVQTLRNKCVWSRVALFLIVCELLAPSADGANHSQTIKNKLESALDGLHKPIITADQRFENPFSTWKNINYWTFIKYLLFTKNNSTVPSPLKLNETLPVISVNPETIATPPEHGIRVTWLGHASVLAQFDQISVLTDPVFSKRASPFSFSGPKRYRPVPCKVQDLPPNLEAVVISHNHYDHLDYQTVQSLNSRYGSKLHWFVPKGVGQWMRDSGCSTVTELSWWETATCSGVTFVFTPTQHWGRRGVTDTNKSLWGSWSIIGPHHRFHFAGDTGYCDAFKQIGEQLGPFDLAAIPIGAYEPGFIMRPQHVDPKESVQIHLDLQAKRSIGIHWGTFVLTTEYYLEPPKKLKEESKAAGLPENAFFVTKHGESKLLFTKNQTN